MPFLLIPFCSILAGLRDDGLIREDPRGAEATVAKVICINQKAEISRQGPVVRSCSSSSRETLWEKSGREPKNDHGQKGLKLVSSSSGSNVCNRFSLFQKLDR